MIYDSFFRDFMWHFFLIHDFLRILISDCDYVRVCSAQKSSLWLRAVSVVKLMLEVGSHSIDSFL